MKPILGGKLPLLCCLSMSVCRSLAAHVPEAQIASKSYVPGARQIPRSHRRHLGPRKNPQGSVAKMRSKAFFFQTAGCHFGCRRGPKLKPGSGFNLKPILGFSPPRFLSENVRGAGKLKPISGFRLKPEPGFNFGPLRQPKKAKAVWPWYNVARPEYPRWMHLAGFFALGKVRPPSRRKSRCLSCCLLVSACFGHQKTRQSDST